MIPVAILGTPSVLPAVRAGEVGQQSPLACVPSPPVPMGEAEIRYSQVIQQIPQPVIAAVDGYAIGSGNILAYTCDFTVATTRSRFGQTGPRVGSPANGPNVAMLAARVGQRRAREIWMLQPPIHRPAVHRTWDWSTR